MCNNTNNHILPAVGVSENSTQGQIVQEKKKPPKGLT